MSSLLLSSDCWSKGTFADVDGQSRSLDWERRKDHEATWVEVNGRREENKGIKWEDTGVNEDTEGCDDDDEKTRWEDWRKLKIAEDKWEVDMPGDKWEVDVSEDKPELHVLEDNKR